MKARRSTVEGYEPFYGSDNEDQQVETPTPGGTP